VHPVTSDAFFRSLPASTRFDLVFLDGLHTFQQTYTDLINSLGRLNAPGIILVDDIVPANAVSALADSDDFRAERARQRLFDVRWHGDVFRLIAVLRDNHRELYWRTIVETGNEQTVIVRRDATAISGRVPDDVLGSYADLGYDDVFADGVPAFFAPGSEDDVVRDISGVVTV
jgi:hypothetical protein